MAQPFPSLVGEGVAAQDPYPTREGNGAGKIPQPGKKVPQTGKKIPRLGTNLGNLSVMMGKHKAQGDALGYVLYWPEV